jgi:hypothetical protein
MVKPSCADQMAWPCSTRTTAEAPSRKRCSTPSIYSNLMVRTSVCLAAAVPPEESGGLVARHSVGIVLSAHTTEDDATIFQQACRMGLEGIVSKRLSAPAGREERGIG